MAVADTGHVGISMVILLAQNDEVIAVDVELEKDEKANNRFYRFKTLI